MSNLRESKKFWAVRNGEPLQVTGYSCAPNNPDVWWFPELGYSKSLGYGVFEDKYAAIDYQIKISEKHHSELTEELKKLRAYTMTTVKIPEGYALVPIDPSLGMMDRAFEICVGGQLNDYLFKTALSKWRELLQGAKQMTDYAGIKIETLPAEKQPEPKKD